MKQTVKEKAAAKYLGMKRKLGKKLDSLERGVVRLDAKVASTARKRGEQVASMLDGTAAKIRRSLSK